MYWPVLKHSVKLDKCFQKCLYFFQPTSFFQMLESTVEIILILAHNAKCYLSTQWKLRNEKTTSDTPLNSISELSIVTFTSVHIIQHADFLSLIKLNISMTIRSWVNEHPTDICSFYLQFILRVDRWVDTKLLLLIQNMCRCQCGLFRSLLLRATHQSPSVWWTDAPLSMSRGSDVTMPTSRCQWAWERGDILCRGWRGRQSTTCFYGLLPCLNVVKTASFRGLSPAQSVAVAVSFHLPFDCAVN